MNTNSKILSAGVLVALSSSLCCIMPIVALFAGASGWAANLSWIEPYRPYFIAATFLILGLAWYLSFRKVKVDNCGCETPKKSFLHSKSFLAIVTVISCLLITFPSYSNLLLDRQDNTVQQPPQDKSKKIVIEVTGMTCAACELHIESDVKKLSGVANVKASYEKKNVTVNYEPTKTDPKKIIEAINATGYKVVESKSK